MTATQVFNIAMNLIGYNDINGEISGEAEIKKNALVKIQMIYQELFRAEGRTETLPVLSSMNDELILNDDTIREIMPYGVAMLMAQSEGDGDNQSLMAALYNQKKARLTRMENGITDIFGGES